MATETVRNLPAQFIEDIGKDLATQITAQTAIPVVAGGPGGLTKQAGEDQAQFDARQKAAQQFGKVQNIAKAKGQMSLDLKGAGMKDAGQKVPTPKLSLIHI